MVRATTRKSEQKTLRPVRRRGRRPAGSPRIKIRRLLLYGVLLVLLAASVSVAGYVIFFRVVVAAETVDAPPPAIVFEEPEPSPGRARSIWTSPGKNTSRYSTAICGRWPMLPASSVPMCWSGGGDR